MLEFPAVSLRFQRKEYILRALILSLVERQFPLGVSPGLEEVLYFLEEGVQIYSELDLVQYWEHVQAVTSSGEVARYFDSYLITGGERKRLEL